MLKRKLNLKILCLYLLIIIYLQNYILTPIYYRFSYYDRDVLCINFISNKQKAKWSTNTYLINFVIKLRYKTKFI